MTGAWQRAKSLVHLVPRLAWPTDRGGWPLIPAADHRLAASIWMRFLASGQYFGRSRLYQGYDPIGLPGLRPSADRARIYGFDALLRPGDRVLDIGCNMGCMTLEAARRAAEVVGIEVNADLLWIASQLQRHSGLRNVRFEQVPFDRFQDAGGFDVIFAFAVHKWVGMPLEAFIGRIEALLRPGGALLLESNNYRRIAAEFDGEVQAFLDRGFSLASSGTTEYETLRRFCVLRRPAKPS